MSTDCCGTVNYSQVWLIFRVLLWFAANISDFTTISKQSRRPKLLIENKEMKEDLQVADAWTYTWKKQLEIFTVILILFVRKHFYRQ